MEERAFGRQLVFVREWCVFARATSWRFVGSFGRGESGIEFDRDQPVSEALSSSFGVTELPAEF